MIFSKFLNIVVGVIKSKIYITNFKRNSEVERILQFRN